MQRKSKIAAGIIIGATVIAALGYFFMVAAPNVLSGYMKITVTEGQGKVVTVGEYDYAFSYAHAVQLTSGSAAYFYVATNISLIGTPYEAKTGATYNAFGLEIQVFEVHASYCILLAKSTVP